MKYIFYCIAALIFIIGLIASVVLDFFYSYKVTLNQADIWAVIVMAFCAIGALHHE
jgi:hypothetical protein